MVPVVRSCLGRQGSYSVNKGKGIMKKLYHSIVTEEKIPVPWGHIAGKHWGNKASHPVVALHGLFDNASSFDSLIPLLKFNHPVLALDIPGFGKSSNPPPGVSPNFLEIVLWLRYLFKVHFKWEKVLLLGHSYGSALAFVYSGLYPDEVDKYISIDCSKANMASKEQYIIDDFRFGYGGGIVKTLNIMREGTYDEFLEDMFNTRSKVNLPLTEEQCRLLLSRDLEKIGKNHYRSLVDPRIHLRHMGRPTLSFLEALSKKIKCEVLTFRASGGILKGYRLEVYEKHIEHMKKNGQRVVSEVVDGPHHVHMENPKEVANLINQFLK